MAHERGGTERGRAVGLDGVRLRLVLQHKPHDRRVALRCGRVQRLSAELERAVHVGARREQQVRRVRVAVDAGGEERRAPLAVSRLGRAQLKRRHERIDGRARVKQ
eukprot:5850026-Prymnesium_polylepis.1